MKLDNNFKNQRGKVWVDVAVAKNHLLNEGLYTKEDIKEELRERKLFLLNQGI